MEESSGRSKMPARRDPLIVLIVDGDTTRRDGLRHYLEGLGNVVAPVESFPGALRLLREVVPDVALLDLGPLGGDGIRILRWMRCRDEYSETRILDLTSPDALLEIGIEAGGEEGR